MHFFLAKGSSKSGETSKKHLVNTSTDESDQDRHSAMRKRNAGRRKRKRPKPDPQGNFEKLIPFEMQRTSKTSFEPSSSESESDYVRSKRKLRHSVEVTNRRLQNIADDIATAIEKARDNSESDDDSNIEDSNNLNNTVL